MKVQGSSARAGGRRAAVGGAVGQWGNGDVRIMPVEGRMKNREAACQRRQLPRARTGVVMLRGGEEERVATRSRAVAAISAPRMRQTTGIGFRWI